MPTYQYACSECGGQLEVWQSFTDGPMTTCPACAGRLRKVFSAVGVVFKGSGFYRTDSRAAAADAKAGEAKAGEAKAGEAKAGEAKPGGKAEPKVGSDGASADGAGGDRAAGTAAKDSSSSNSSPDTPDGKSKKPASTKKRAESSS